MERQVSERVPFSIPVRGGELAGAVWEPVGDPTATVLAVHGIASSHLAWAWLADALPTVRIIAPDLRGRGRSRDLPGPWGMPQHAEDCLAALDALGVERVVAVGHSMGCFVVGAVIAAAGGRLDDVVFVDGGLPIPLPPGVTEADLPGALVGPQHGRPAHRWPI